MDDPRRMRRRLDAIRFLLEVEREVGAFVPIMTAARVLGVERRRVVELIDAGRLRCVEVPGGARGDRFVPVRDLISAPFREEVGRRGRFGADRQKKISRPRKGS